jgi:hypothetical protein
LLSPLQAHELSPEYDILKLLLSQNEHKDILKEEFEKPGDMQLSFGNAHTFGCDVSVSKVNGRLMAGFKDGIKTPRQFLKK